MDVREPIEGSAIEVHLTGKEHTVLSTLLSTIHGEHHLFDESLTISKLQEEPLLDTGIYRLPFSFYLPANVPPSIQFDDEKGNSAGLQYTLEARVLKHNRKTACNINIVGAPCHHFQEPHFLQQPKAISLKSFGILDQGRVLAAGKVYDTHLGKGERLLCALSIRNESKLEIERVDLQLLEEVEYRACAHEKRHTTKIVSEQDINIPAMVLASTTVPEFGDEVCPSTFEEMISHLSWKQNTLEVKIPQRSIDTYHGKLVTVKHDLQVLIYLKGRFQHPIIVMRADILVHDPPLEDSSHMKNHHQIKPATSEEVARTKWPKDGEALLDNHDEAPDVPTIIEPANGGKPN